MGWHRFGNTLTELKTKIYEMFDNKVDWIRNEKRKKFKNHFKIFKDEISHYHLRAASQEQVRNDDGKRTIKKDGSSKQISMFS